MIIKIENSFHQTSKKSENACRAQMTGHMHISKKLPTAIPFVFTRYRKNSVLQQEPEEDPVRVETCCAKNVKNILCSALHSCFHFK
jgi:hypothetical protein